MAMGIPCITSSLANNALKAADNKEILIGSTPEEYKHLILNLLSDTEKSNSIAAAGKKYVENTFNWTGSTQKLIQLIENKQ
jgi:glycosyltransferase involved in cell wall biosynthesis